jgi:hypothetical protein
MGTNVFQYPGKGTRIVHFDLDPNSLGRTYRESCPRWATRAKL